MRIGVLDSDDIGHEIVPAAVEVARAARRRRRARDTAAMTRAIVAGIEAG